MQTASWPADATQRLDVAPAAQVSSLVHCARHASKTHDAPCGHPLAQERAQIDEMQASPGSHSAADPQPAPCGWLANAPGTSGGSQSPHAQKQTDAIATTARASGTQKV